MSETPTQGTSPDKAKTPGGKVVPMMVLVVVIVLVGAAFVYAGGIDYVNGLLGNAPAGTSPAPDATKLNASTASTSSATIAGSSVPTGLADRMFIEQIESAKQIARLADGQMTEFAIDKVVTRSNGETWAAVTAKFVNAPTTMKGVMAFAKTGEKYYFLWIQAITPAESTPDGLMNSHKLTEPTEPTAEEYSEAGVTAADPGVVNTIIASQTNNQGLVAGLLDGTYTKVTLAAPSKGPGTISVPVTVSGGTGTDAIGAVTLIVKSIEGKDRTFVASFEKR